MLNIFPIALFLYLATDLKLPLEKAHIKQRNLNEGPFVLDKNKRLGSFVFLLSIRAIVFIVNSSFVLFALTKCLRRGFRSKFERLLSRFY